MAADYSVNEFVSENILPAQVRVVGGVPQDETKSLDLGREVTLLYVEEDLLVRLEDANGRSFHERVSLEACRFRLLPNTAALDDRTFATVRHVLEFKTLPEVVRAQSGYSLDEINSEDVIEPGDVFEVGTGSCFKNGIECAIWFRLSTGRAPASSADELESDYSRARNARRARGQRREPITVPLDADSDFHTCVDERKYYLRELVHLVRSKCLRLPARICVVSEDGSEGERLPDKLLGRKLTIVELPTRRSVIATDGYSLFRLTQDLCASLRVKACNQGSLISDVCVRTMASFIDSNKLRTVGPPEPASITSQLFPLSTLPTSLPVNSITSAITSPVKMAPARDRRHLSASTAQHAVTINPQTERRGFHTLPRQLPRVPSGEESSFGAPVDFSWSSRGKAPSKTRNAYEDIDIQEPAYSYNSLKRSTENGVHYSGDSGVQVAEYFDDLNYAIVPEASRKTFTTNGEKYTSSSRVTHESVSLRSRSPGPRNTLPNPIKTLSEDRRSRSTPNLDIYNVPRPSATEERNTLSPPEPKSPLPKSRLAKRPSQDSILANAVHSRSCKVPLPPEDPEVKQHLNAVTKELDSCKWELNEAKFEVDRLKRELAKLKATCHCSKTMPAVYTNYEYNVPRSARGELIYQN